MSTDCSRVILIRHGLTANVPPRGLIDLAAVQLWRDGTNALGIATHSVPPRSLVERVASAKLVMASDLPRAVESAERLAPGRDITISPLFRESITALPRWLPLRWPLRVWRLATGTQWVYHILRGTDAPPEDLARAAAASKWLGELARDHKRIAVVCHGVFRRLLGRRLITDGWTREPGRHSYANWSAWEYGWRRR